MASTTPAHERQSSDHGSFTHELPLGRRGRCGALQVWQHNTGNTARDKATQSGRTHARGASPGLGGSQAVLKGCGVTQRSHARPLDAPAWSSRDKAKVTCPSTS